jgi:hypothetical protein
MKPFGMTNGLEAGSLWRRSDARNSMAFRPEQRRQFRRAFCAARYGRQEIEKRTLACEVLALKVPFGAVFTKPSCYPNEVPWPGRLRLLSLNLDAGRCREMQQKRPASHTSALGELFIADEWEIAQEGILGYGIFISLVRGGNDGSSCEFDSGKQIPRDEAARNDKILLRERLYFRVRLLWEFKGYEFGRGFAAVD